MDARAALTALNTGDVRALLSALDADERQDWVFPATPVSEAGTVTLARFGAIAVGIMTDGDVVIHTHVDVDTAVQCHAWKRELLSQAATEIQGMLDNPLVALLAQFQAQGEGPMFV